MFSVPTNIYNNILRINNVFTSNSVKMSYLIDKFVSNPFMLNNLKLQTTRRRRERCALFVCVLLRQYSWEWGWRLNLRLGVFVWARRIKAKPLNETNINNLFIFRSYSLKIPNRKIILFSTRTNRLWIIWMKRMEWNLFLFFHNNNNYMAANEVWFLIGNLMRILKCVCHWMFMKHERAFTRQPYTICTVGCYPSIRWMWKDSMKMKFNRNWRQRESNGSFLS